VLIERSSLVDPLPTRWFAGRSWRPGSALLSILSLLDLTADLTAGSHRWSST